MDKRLLDFKVALAMGWTKHKYIDGLQKYPYEELITFKDSAEEEYYHMWVPREFDGDTNFSRKVPNFSIDMTAAWEVLRYLRGYEFTVKVSDNPYLEKKWNCEVQKVQGSNLLKYSANDWSAPEAICKAALEALKEIKE